MIQNQKITYTSAPIADGDDLIIPLPETLCKKYKIEENTPLDIRFRKNGTEIILKILGTT